ncbi:aminopeptidase [Clostridium botulinum]|uniref:aminopeptidase n=1 Tax=Clostridium botulinum TaxID=1491 RepID=UPI00077413F3|nr:aminopeptidase [Clostridium botulinum]NFH80565.1 aminopeptidase [Clostridium botulinum]NFH84743.1 aminopeptidase [Clostridium botulinum]NFI11807.1 aminopeptidase [Clostridium botulinum]NFI14838.1 aminopeptidase [Clostridium botulinum]NFO84921.1 aminopeptidase [Clostridium botulinum]
MNKDLLRKYAKLTVNKGVNLQKDGILVINSPIECYDFARLMAEEGYNSGAKDVYINYSDASFNKIKLINSSKEILSEVYGFERDKYDYFVENNASFISISASDPDLLKGVDSSKISAYQKSRNIALKNYRNKCSSNKNAWCIVSIPTEGWAKKVFPNVSVEEATEKLWDVIFSIMRLKENDPIEAWNKHTETLSNKVQKLNNDRFKYLKFKNSLGTDLTIELVNNHLWCGGADKCENGGFDFIANMPTEEVFSTPKYDGVNGVVFSSKPLSYCGNIINDFSLTFKDGKVIDCSAKEGLDVLKELLNTDEGSKHLGEVALVPYDSPISNSNIIFYNTLYDENASCHLALGSSYSSCIKNGESMSEDELFKLGCNKSLSHVDFMIGTKDTSIIGIKEDGTEVQIFKDGNWA